MDTFLRNLRYAARTLRRSPFTTAVAVLSLALGIGANAAIYSLFEQMLLRPPPVPHPERLVNLSAPGLKQGWTSCDDAGECDAVFSLPMFRDLQRADAGALQLAAHRGIPANLAFAGQTLNGRGLLVSGSYFPTLGLKPVLGRLLTSADAQTQGGHPVAVLSYSYWQTNLGADPGVLNRTLVVNGQPLTVVGVAPRGFDGTTLGVRPQVFVPLSMTDAVLSGQIPTAERQTYWLYLFGRLKPGVSLERAAAALNAVYRPVLAEVEAPLQGGMGEQELARFRAKQIALEQGQRGQSRLDASIRTPLTLLLAVTGIVLLIACANIANLLLARGAGRRMEMAVRLSLGASRRHVLAQLLTESSLLALLGGAASLLVAQWTLAGIASILPPESAATLQLGLRPAVVLFAAALSVGTGLLFGLFPALHSTRPDLVTTIRANAGQITGARSAARFRTVLVTAQIALSMLLLVAAGLFLRSLLNISRVDLGLRADQVVTFAISPELNGYKPARSRGLFQRVEEQLAATPGVTGVSASLLPILSSSEAGSNVLVEGVERKPGIDSDAQYNKVGPGYFRTLEIPLLAGREFTLADRTGAPRVAVVNEAFANKFGLGQRAVGKRIGAQGAEEPDLEIVGIVANAKYSEVKDEVPPQFFTPYRQDSTVGAMTFYVRTAGDPRQILRSVPRVIAGLDPNLPVENLKTLPQQVRENVSLDRMISTLSAAFAALATLLAAIGLYGVLAYTVAQRTREIGVRMALGAGSRQIRTLVLGQVGRMILVGGVIGIVAALGLGRVAGSLLFGLKGNDPLVIALAAVTLTGVALAAGYLPARRATRVDPMVALRAE